jgi:hypothetical protein
LAKLYAEVVSLKLTQAPDVGTLKYSHVDPAYDPAICSYCGEPYDRCPCGLVDHWSTNPCPTCGPKPS